MNIKNKIWSVCGIAILFGIVAIAMPSLGYSNSDQLYIQRAKEIKSQETPQQRNHEPQIIIPVRKNVPLTPPPMETPDPVEIIIEKTVSTTSLPPPTSTETPHASTHHRHAPIEPDIYTLGSEDRIAITVYGEKDLSGKFKIADDGTISMPLIGVVKISNLTIREAEEVIKTKLRNGYLKNPDVSIEVAESRPFYILGEVRRPGSYNYIGGMSVLQAVAISGGYTYRANKKFVEILRGNTANNAPVKIEPEATIRAGDIIFVRERFF